MPQPPLEAFVDDPLIDGPMGLLRRLNPGWIIRSDDGVVAPDENGRIVVSGSAFQQQTLDVATNKGYPGRCMSLGIKEEIFGVAGQLDIFQLNPEEFGVGEVKAHDLREQGFGLQRVAEIDMPWHVVAFHLGSTSQAKKAQTPLARNCDVHFPPNTLECPDSLHHFSVTAESRRAIAAGIQQ